MIERRPQQASRKRLGIVLGILFVVVLSASSVVRFYTDLLWFDEIGLRSVFWKVISAKTALGAAGGLAAAIIVWINLEVARRGAPRTRFIGPAGDVAERYRTMFQPYARWVNLGIAAVVGLLTGLSTSVQWQTFQLWRHAQAFGERDPLFGRDIGFFVFRIPFQRLVLAWALGVIVVSILVSLLAHLLNGSIEPQQNGIAIRPIVKVHVSVLLGLVAILKAYGYRLAQFDLVYSPRGTVTGASYTDVHAQLPALKLLIVIALVSGLIFFLNIRFRGWLLPGAAIALWAFSSIVIGAVIPAAVQRFRVEPSESERERPYIRQNIEATRKAFALDKIQLQEFPADQALDQKVLEANRDTVDNMRLWDPATLQDVFKRLQAIRTYYEFTDVDVDRYTIDGRTRQIMLAPREVEPDNLEDRAKNWVNTKLTYTHGYGAVAVGASGVTPEGQPQFLVRDLPPQGPDAINPGRAGIYYGENMSGYAVVKTKQLENDYPKEQGQEQTTYSGEGGVVLNSFLRRLAFGWRFADTNLVISNFVTPESRLIFRRDILDRVQSAAPFLRFDRDPYVVVADDKLYWIVDAYTETDRYPYSQEISLGDTTGVQSGAINYIRNSVKIVIDAYDGTTDFYIADATDPIIATYSAVFPGMFKPLQEMPASIVAHLRYPEDLFTLQAWQYRLYHVTEPDRLYSREDVWEFPADPTVSTEESKIPMSPYYVYMRLPGEEKPEFLLMLPFTPRAKQVLNGWVAARSDPGKYGQLVGFSFPRGQSIDGPELISSRINVDPVVSEQFTLWDRSGSTVKQGNLFVIPIGTSLIYYQPIYLQAANSPIPELKRVAVVYGTRVAFEPTLEAALAKAIAGQPSQVEPVPDGEVPEVPAATPRPPSGDVASLLEQAAQHFRAADEALRAGDLAAYQREVRAAQQAVEAARAAG